MKKSLAGTAARTHRRPGMEANWKEWISASDAGPRPPENACRPAAATAFQPPHEAIARLAFTLWHERGCPFGSPEEDWLRAERQLVQQHALQ